MSGAAIGYLAVALVVVIVGVVWTIRSGRRGPGTAPPYVLALRALADGDADTAFREFKGAVQNDSTNVDAYIRLGRLLRERGDAERAFQIHREVASRHGLPARIRSRVQHALAHDLVALGRLDKAAEAAREAVRLADDPGPALETHLDILRQLDDTEGAFRLRRDILKREGKAKSGNPELAAFRAEQGEALLERGELDRAEKILKEARKLDPKNPDAAWWWGILQEKRGNHGEAIGAWEDILRDRPELVVDLFRSLERVRFLDGSYSEIERSYVEFLEKRPGHEDASFGLARFLRRKGHLDEALEVCRRGLDANPDSEPLSVLNLALLLQTDRAAEAESALHGWIGGMLGEGGPDGRSAVAPEAAAPGERSLESTS